MDILHSCCCCLQRAPDKDVKTPYKHFGNEEIYEDMLKECFNIHLTLHVETCGICEPCVGRLRDASAFKLQVQRSQAELLHLERTQQLRISDAVPSAHIKLEKPDDTETTQTYDDMPYEEPLVVKLEVEEEYGGVEFISFENRLVMEVEDDGTSGGLMLDEQSPVKKEGPASESDCISFARGDVKRVFAAPHTSLAFDASGHTSLKEMPGSSKKTSKIASTDYERPIPGPKAMSCKTCREGFTKKSHLLRHMVIHTGEKSFSCDICNKQFGRKSTLVTHKRIHTGEKPYGCEICNRHFTDKTALRNHQRSHTGDKPFECELCNKPFAQKSHLVSHRRSHKGEKPYSCEICKSSFTEKSSLTKHMSIHSGEKPYNCDICGKPFRERDHLKTHRKTHTGEKPYTCDICNKKFSQKINIRNHLKRHELKPYHCEICCTLFADSETLKKHMRKHKRAKKSLKNTNKTITVKVEPIEIQLA